MTTTASKADKKSSKGKAVDSRLIRRLYLFLEPQKYYVLLALVLTLFVAWLGTVRPYLTQIAIDDHIAIGDVDGLLWIIVLILLSLVGESVILIATTYLTRWVGQGTLLRLRMAVFDKLQSLNVQYFDRSPLGRLITRTTNDVEAIDELVSSGVVTILGDLLRIGFIIYFMLQMSFELTLVSLSTLPILIYATILFKAKVRVAFLDVRDQVARLNSFIQEHINGMSIVQLFGRQKEESRRFRAINATHREAHIRTVFYFALFWPVVEVLSSLAMAIVVWYGGGAILLEGVTFGVLLAFIQYVRQFFIPIRDLSDKFNTLQSAMAASERIFSVLDEVNPIQSAQNPIQPAERKGGIRFENVWFRYNDKEDWVLKDVSFEAEPGKIVAIVGSTGAGKTTIINLITRFYDIQKGRILLDGIDIRDMDLSYLRNYFSLVLQDNALFSGSILNNITLGNPAITREQVEEAVKLVQADTYINKLPGGLDFELRERGASLSLGQRQLLCFVRAIVYNPKVLILDEATSSVDSETEYLVTQATKVLMGGRTSMIVAHRLSTIQHADTILVMHKGAIREMGNHRELMKKEDGIYRKLYELQYRDQLTETEK
jgi:ATP-binding cassette, subfamily B, multidrug efflux pump